jgi:Zn ribbon nucleic-acid-binding protein
MTISKCVFCGGGSCFLNQADSGFGFKNYVECPNCKAKGPFMIFEDDAITEWNVARQAVEESYHKPELNEAMRDKINAAIIALDDVKRGLK